MELLSETWACQLLERVEKTKFPLQGGFGEGTYAAWRGEAETAAKAPEPLSIRRSGVVFSLDPSLRSIVAFAP